MLIIAESLCSLSSSIFLFSRNILLPPVPDPTVIWTVRMEQRLLLLQWPQHLRAGRELRVPVTIRSSGTAPLLPQHCPVCQRLLGIGRFSKDG